MFQEAIRGTAAKHYSPVQIEAWCPTEYDETAWGRARERAWTVVVELDGDVIGFCDLTDDAELDMLFVAPSAGGQGVARLLVGEVLAYARGRGHSAVTTRASRAARPAFEQFGFVVDRANPDSVIRGVAVPNFSMHIDLT
ncbi:GNAT family N-acetyltransferase [Actinomycetota bacterium]